MGRMESPDNYEHVSAKLKNERAERFLAYLDEHDVSKSEVVRRGIDAVLADAGTVAESTTPLQPPTDDQLAYGYQRLVDAANDNGVVKGTVAERVTTNGPRNLSKQDTRDLVLRPLHDRGYIRRIANQYGNEAWALVRFTGTNRPDCPECESTWTDVSHYDDDHYIVLICEDCDHEFIDPREFARDAAEEEADAAAQAVATDGGER